MNRSPRTFYSISISEMHLSRANSHAYGKIRMFKVSEVQYRSLVEALAGKAAGFRVTMHIQGAHQIHG
jgi:hypothetical protein